MDVSRAKTSDPDEWLEAAPDLSRPIVAELREWIFRTAPDLTESIKWNCLCFSGRKLVCGLSACKKHVGISFFRGTELSDPAGLFCGGESNTNIRNIRFTSLTALDRKALAGLLLGAVELDARGDLPPVPKMKREPWPMPEFFSTALAQKKHRKAAEGFQRLSPSCQREYLVWLSTAKREETRADRLRQTLAALAAGRKWLDRRRS